MIRNLLLVSGWMVLGALQLVAGQPQAATVDAYQKYVQQTEAGLMARHGLWVDQDARKRQRVRGGVVLVEPRTGKGLIEIEGGLIHDWIGTVFLPGVSLEQVLALVQDYDRHKSIYPDVLDSKTIQRDGEHFRVFLRLKRKQIITVVLDTDHDVRYERLSKTAARSTSYTTRIAEVDKAGAPSERVMPPSASHGYLWRLHSFWRFEERDGGVFIECEAVSMTRRVPTGLGWMVEPIIRDLPGESLQRTLEATRKALAK